MGSPTKLSGFSLNPSYLQITPLSLVILFFLLFPVITIIIVSFGITTRISYCLILFSKTMNFYSHLA